MDKELRKWAIEQAIKLHGANGVTTEKALAEARTLLEFVTSGLVDPNKPVTFVAGGDAPAATAQPDGA